MYSLSHTKFNFNLKKTCYILFCVCSSFHYLYAQETIIKGRVTDAQSGDGLPFVNLYFKGSTVGVTTDFEGYYTLKTKTRGDSLSCSYIGYITRTKPIQKNKLQTINFQLSPDQIQLEEVEIKPGENPAFRILTKVDQNREKNNKSSLNAYQFENYSKVQVSIDHISEKYRKKKVFRPITSLFDSLKVLAGEEGSAVLPVFVSETVSDYYYLKNPFRTKEIIKASKITGVGLSDNSFISQLMGSTFQVFNFYDSWVTILGKNFISPISPGGKHFYFYILKDSTFIGDSWSYEIQVVPKNPLDLAFNGTIWVNDTTFALKQVDLEISKDANINYIERLKIQQEFVPTYPGPWLPSKTRILIDIKELDKKAVGMVAKFYTSSKYIIVNQPNSLSWYKNSIETVEDANYKEGDYWEENRHEKISETEKNVYKMIDTLKRIPAVKTFAEIVDIAVNGYMKIGKIDIGPYIFLYSNNYVEGHRFRIGFRTNQDYSRRWIFSGYTAYGTLDKKFKYNLQTELVFSRKVWTVFGIQRREDVDQIGITDDYFSKNNLFSATSRWVALNRLNHTTENRFWIENSPIKGLTQFIMINHKHFFPYFDFGYYPETNNNSKIASSFTTTELIAETQYTSSGKYLQKYNKRVLVGVKFSPVFTLRYTRGIRGLLNSNFNYDKISVNVSHKVKLNALGNSVYSLTLGKVFSTLPYPLLEVHKGNETVISNPGNFFLMNFFEFVSDEYITLIYEHHLEGLFLNRIPLMKRLKLRELATFNLAYGKIKDENNQPINNSGQKVEPFSTLKSKPYVEAGFGIENILNFIRVDVVYRLTYINKTYLLQHPSVDKIGLKIYFQFRF